jgi:transcriptional accessory protein Tex/SPT6
MDWIETLLRQFPDWETPEAMYRWSAVRSLLAVGQFVSGVVISRAPFGVWLDIGVEWPALLLVPEMKDAGTRRIRFEDYPELGTMVDGWVVALGERGEIAVTQRPKKESTQKQI